MAFNIAPKVKDIDYGMFNALAVLIDNQVNGEGGIFRHTFDNEPEGLKEFIAALETSGYTVDKDILPSRGRIEVSITVY